ncbi:zinc-dependent metalloprotease [Hymenobacter sp. J193]|uniref:zinc-dependent metalloprotease n=1 Tax=Hymenobacter sp. J193 TaxID=2898429 RepID=UPI002150CB2D|nr:zinc-dependent metalloprotease [Hymenobacter sp. J193]MCR5888893.1 zinc-dependent metalloprotease [Hymenobacter sp. J193]
MKNAKLLVSALLMAGTALFSSCSKQEEVAKNDAPSEETLSQIRALGFSTHDVKREGTDYIVEGDIRLSASDLKNKYADGKLLRVGEEEQYRTTYLVRGPRTITLSVSSTLPSAYVTAIDEVVRRYNAENLTLRFQRVSTGGNIVFTKAPSGASYLASAGFPTSGGNPYSQVVVNSTYLGSNPGTNYLATILAHEAGHCIGFRHTDYMNRAYSCGGAYTNEGASTVGAIRISGTPSAADPNSWMLACVGSGVNRPFNANDKIALNYLY